MVSDEKCIEILTKYNENEISKDDIKLIRSFLYEWALIEIKIEKEKGL